MAHFIKLTPIDGGEKQRVNIDLVESYGASKDGSWLESKHFDGVTAFYVKETPEQIDYLVDEAQRIPVKAPWQR